MSAAWQFLLAGIGTYLIRLSAIGLVASGVRIPPEIERTLRFIAPAVLAAIVANSLVFVPGGVNPRVSWYAGALLGAVLAWRTRSAGWAMAAAIALVWALQAAGLP